MLKITHLASRKSYLLLICPNSYKTFTKSEIRSSLSRFEHCSKSCIKPNRKSYLVIILPNSPEKLTKSNIRSSWSRFKQCSISFALPLGSHSYLLLIDPSSHEKLLKSEIRYQIYSSSLYDVISLHNWSQST